MRISKEEIIELLEKKGFTCDSLDEYKNLETILSLTCNSGHKFQACLKDIRLAKFQCPKCMSRIDLSNKPTSKLVPIKKGIRVVAIDNATNNLGVSIFDDGDLVFYHQYTLYGDTDTRMLKNRLLLENTILNEGDPNFVCIEDIQYQNSIPTFKTLAMLLGSTVISVKKAGVEYATVLSKVGRSHFWISGKTRNEQKLQAIAKVKTMWNIQVGDDVAEAILLGKYAVDMLNQKKHTPAKLF